MQFYEYLTTRDLVRKGPLRCEEDSETFDRRQFNHALTRLGSKSCAFQMVSEGTWEKDHRPFYCVWPSIAPMLLRLSLDLDTSLVKPPMPVFLIRFPREKPPLCWDDGHIRSILVGPTSLHKGDQIFDGFVLWVDTGERDKAPDGTLYPVHTYINLPMKRGMTLEESLRALPYDPSAYQGIQMPEEIRTNCARLACTICLLENDPELIEPDVLAKDRDKFEITRDAKYVERAKRRGKVGWNVGKGIEVIPHVRRPHPALMHTGHGRTVPRIVLRKGSVIHREVVTHVPTGFHG